jgi:ubiquinone/menaquinone biosynthesis C-methylase UbiE
LITGTHLPFADDSFDVVLSNHVIEHVEDQGEHLKELRRVLREDGICYLATPNKSSPIMQGHVGNEMVLRYHQMQPLFERYGFRVFEYSTQVLTEPDRYSGPFRMGRYLPRRLAYVLRSYYPSQHFVLEPID